MRYFKFWQKIERQFTPPHWSHLWMRCWDWAKSSSWPYWVLHDLWFLWPLFLTSINNNIALCQSLPCTLNRTRSCRLSQYTSIVYFHTALLWLVMVRVACKHFSSKSTSLIQPWIEFVFCLHGGSVGIRTHAIKPNVNGIHYYNVNHHVGGRCDFLFRSRKARTVSMVTRLLQIGFWFWFFYQSKGANNDCVGKTICWLMWKCKH